MPHILVKVRTGYTEARKGRLCAALHKAIVAILDCPSFDVSVGIEDVRPADWAARVYEPDILGKPDTIYKHPGCAEKAHSHG
jgi:4-oxalocrotonate tautomerase